MFGVKRQTLQSRLRWGGLILREKLADFAAGLDMHSASGPSQVAL